MLSFYTLNVIMLNVVMLSVAVAARGLNYKALRIRNVQMIHILSSKLVPFIQSLTNTLVWTQHASLLRNPYITNP